MKKRRVSMVRFGLTKIALFFAMLIVMGCHENEDIILAENRSVNGIITLLELHDAQFPGSRPTNLAQLFKEMGSDYPHNSHEKFASFGEHSGFTNSFFEKYAFVPVGAKHKQIRGEIFLLNSKSFPYYKGKFGRLIVSKVGEGPDAYRSVWCEESKVQQIFKEAGVEIPKASPLPAPPPAPPTVAPKPQYPLTVQVQMFFQRFAMKLGLNRSDWLNLLLLCFITTLLTVIFLFIWLGRRGRR